MMPSEHSLVDRRVWVCTLLVALVLVLGLFCLKRWPAASVDVKWTETPFYGEGQGSAFLWPAWHDTKGQRLAHKVILGVVLGVAFVLAFVPMRAWLWTKLRAVRWPTPKTWARFLFRGRWVFGVLAALFLIREAAALWRVPNFAATSDGEMANLNYHFTGVLGQADRLAYGDILFRDIIPYYGMIQPVLLAGIQKLFGLLSFGEVFRLLLGLELVSWVIILALFGMWSRWRWLTCVLPVLLLVPFYWSGTNALCAPNHGPWRMMGSLLMLAVLLGMRRRSPRFVQTACGLVAAVALMMNTETGVAATAGLVMFLHFRYTSAGRERRQGNLVTMGVRFVLGGLAALGLFAVMCRLVLGHFPDVFSLRHHYEAFRLSMAGFGSYPYDGSLWPVLLLAHAAWVLLYCAWSDNRGYRQCARAAICIFFLVWYAYFVHRPHQEYLCSFYIPYGLLLVDLGRACRLLVRRPRHLYGARAVLLGLVLLCVLPKAFASVDWSWDPRGWRVHTMRWSVPLVSASKAPTGTLISDVYCSPAYADALLQRANFLKEQAHGQRLVYFTLDSYLMPRLAGVIPLQAHVDPGGLPTRFSYERFLKSLFELDVAELYVDSRNAAEVVYYGGVFQLLLQDLATRYHLARVESGWEIWRRGSGTSSTP